MLISEARSHKTTVSLPVCCCQFSALHPRVLEAGCLDLPNLQSLKVCDCVLEDAGALLGIIALQGLTRIESSDSQGPPILAQLVHLPRLQRMVYTFYALPDGAPVGLPRLPADMGSLSLTLLHLDVSGHGLTHFPLALTQLAALECLRAEANEFAELPAAIAALSRLTELALGRALSDEDPLQLHEKRPLDARALGDLSGSPALCKLSFESCEVMLSEALLGAVRHASLASVTFSSAHPAPECALVLLQLSQALRRLRRGSVLRFVANEGGAWSLTRCGMRRGGPPFTNSRQRWTRVGCEVLGKRQWGVQGSLCVLYAMKLCSVCSVACCVAVLNLLPHIHLSATKEERCQAAPTHFVVEFMQRVNATPNCIPL